MLYINTWKHVVKMFPVWLKSFYIISLTNPNPPLSEGWLALPSPLTLLPPSAPKEDFSPHPYFFPTASAAPTQSVQTEEGAAPDSFEPSDTNWYPSHIQAYTTHRVILL